MVRWIGAVVALSLVGSPAMAQTSRKKNATKTEAKAEEKKPKPRPEPAEEEEPKPKKKRAPPPDEDESTNDSEKVKKETRETVPFHEKTSFGVSVLLGPALSTSNSEKKLTPLPFASLAFSIDGKVNGPAYFRLEPSLGYLRRKSTVNVVRKVDASDYPNVKIFTEDLVNRVTALDFTVRALLGYDFTRDLTSRAGILFGLSSAATDAADCSSDNRTTGAIYGAHLTPLAWRVFSGNQNSQAIELGLSAELRSQKLPRCDIPLKGEFQVNAGEVATFKPKKIESQFTSVAVALQAAIFF